MTPNDRVIMIEDTPEFTQVCRQLRLTIEAAHGHGQHPAQSSASVE